MPEIDKITLEVEGKATDSVKGIDNLITKLKGLDTAVTSVSPQLTALSSSFRGVANSASSLSNINFNGTVSGMQQLGQALNILQVYTSDMKNMQSNLKGISSGVNSMKRAMASLGEVAPIIQSIDMTSITSQVQELSKLGQLSESFTSMKDGAKAFNTSINTMNKGADKFPEMMKKINNLDLSKFKVQVKELANVMGTFTQTINSTATSLAGFSKSVTGLPSSVSKATSAVTKAQKGSASAGAGGIFGLGGGANLLSNIYMLGRIGKGFGTVLKRANDFIETMNLFGVVMGENTKKANEFQEQLQVLGVDREQSMRFQSSFYDIGTSLGMTSKNAYTLSEQFTKLGYDYASLYNIPVEQSFEKLQSGIVGVVRPLRGLGKDISEAKLKETALTLGIQENVRAMAQSDKAMLRFITLMRQSGSAMNDMERTLHTPANALRVLKAQFASLTRELGALFIPILANVLPYIIAIAKFLRGVIADIASFFGIKMFELDFSGVNTSMGIADDYSADMADNLDSGAASAKKLKDHMLGIDELNVLNTDTGSIGKDTGATGVGGGGGGVLDDFDLEQFGYDELMKNIKDKSEDILETFNEWKGVLGVIAGVLAVAWTAGKIYTFIQALKGVTTASTIAMGIKGIGGLVTTFFSLAGTGGILGTVATGFVVLGDKIIMALGFGAIGSATVAGLVGFGVVLAGVAVAAWGIYEAMQPAFESVDLFGEGVSDVTESKLKPFIDTFNGLDTQLKTLDWSNKVIKTEDVNSIMEKVNSMVEGVLNEVDADRNADLKDLEMLQGLEGVTAETYEMMVKDTNEFYDNVTKRTQEGKDRIKAITEKAAAEERALSTEEREEINKINEQMRDDAINTMTESEEEQMLILNRLKFNTLALSLEQAEEILTNAKENHKNQSQELEDWKTRSLAQLEKKHKEEGIMTDEEYAKAQAAIETSYNERKGVVDQTLKDITDGTKGELGEQSKWIDWETGKQKKSWEKWAVDIGDWFSKAGKWFDEKLIQPIVNGWNSFWSFDWLSVLWDGIWGAIKDVGSKIGGWFDEKIIQPLRKGWDDFWGGLGNWWDETNWNPGNWFKGGKSRMAMGVDFVANNNVSPAPMAFAQGGFAPQRAGFVSPDSWTAGEAGRELIGSYKGKTTVMPLENTSFVSTMYDAVYDAVRDASKDNEITVVVQPKVKLDSRDIHQAQEEYKFKSGGSLIKKR